MPYIKDWNTIKTKIENYEWARKLYQTTKDNTDWYVEHYYDDPDWISGWGHNYVCEKCGEGLSFNRESPRVHVCSVCKHENTGDRQNEVWNSIYRNQCNGNVNSAAMLYKLTGEAKYLDYIKRVLTFYLENYENLKSWSPHPRYLGRISGIHLTDAGDVISILTGMTIVRDELDPAFIKALGEKFFIPEAKYLMPFIYYINNIPVWEACAVAMVALFYGLDDMLAWSFQSEYGLINQVEKGITKDKFWYEGSVHYHFYCIAPMTNLYYYMTAMGCEADYVKKMGETLLQMHVMPAELAFENGVLPNPNDGWPFLALADYAGSYDTMNASFNDPMLQWVCANVYDGRSTKLSRTGEPTVIEGGMQRLLFGLNPQDYDKFPRPHVGTKLWEDTNFCMLRDGGIEVFLKFGLVIGSHSHDDIMNTEISAFGDVISFDLSSNGYGSFLFGEWQRVSLSHVTVLADMKNHTKKNRGKCLLFDEKTNHVVAKADDVYENIDFTRDQKLGGGRLTDIFTAEDKTGAAHIYDYTFYCKGELEYDFEAAPCGQIFDQNGYQHLQNPQKYVSDSDIVLTFVQPDKQTKLTIKGEKGTTLYLFKSYVQSINNQRWGIIIRREGGAKTVYHVDYDFSQK